MIEFLVTMIIFVFFVYIIYIVVGFLKLPAVISQLVYLLLGLIFLLWILDYAGIYNSGSWGRGGGGHMSIGK